MPTSSWFHLFLDVPRADLRAATSFWSEVTGWECSPARGEHGQFATLVPRFGDAWVKVQAVGQEGAGVHLDIDCGDDAGVVRTVELVRDLGGRSVGPFEDVEVMNSPGGLPFCLTPAGGSSVMPRGAVSVLDQVCIDIPEPLWDAEVRFWSQVTGREIEPGPRPEFAFLSGPSTAPRILLQRLTTNDGPVRAHPDFAVADRPEQTARHLAAGAELLVEFDWWSVLLAPGGQVYCLTDRDPSTGHVLPGAFS